MKKIIVVGGGAAGMMAAISAASSGAIVTLIEKNEKLGKKIYITGKGRCNVTNDCEPDEFFSSVVNNSKFMYSSYYCFDSNMMIDFLSSNGCDLKVERGNRVFPVSDHSSDIINTLLRVMKKYDVKVLLRTEVKQLLLKDNLCFGIKLANGDELLCDSVIVATGGLSYPSTGSTGEGILWAKKSNHSIKACRPALVPMNIKEEWVKELQGLSLKNVSLKLVHNNRCYYEGFGEMLFTHFGVSGPLILSASSFCSSLFIGDHLLEKGISNIKNDRIDFEDDNLYAETIYRDCDTNSKSFNIENDAKLILDLKSALDFEQLDKRLLRDFDKFSNKQFKNSLGDLLPAKLIPVIVRLSGISGEKCVNLITKEERHSLVYLLKNIELTISSLRNFNEAIITQGGVSVKNINPSTMESKIVKNLYFAGEMIDVDALTGGFNLQIAWSTGHLAGQSAAEE